MANCFAAYPLTFDGAIVNVKLAHMPTRSKGRKAKTLQRYLFKKALKVFI